ncbi:MAG TPA: hypothetical protein PLL78_08945 [Fimbriimonadaceae bacterium]|nr:hypothetical protein [Fimbriimonadaceae bacterium]HRJ96800.1 hypothetical protein [Fimbriimonadaceae bacterium]
MLRLAGRLRIRFRALAGPDLARVSPDEALSERQDQLALFRVRFDRLAAILNEASHYGPSHTQERQYAELRAWMLGHYGALRRHVAAYLHSGQAAPIGYSPGDEVESLFSAPTLGELLRCDDGRLPAKVRLASEALERYRAHLSTLATVSSSAA